MAASILKPEAEDDDVDMSRHHRNSLISLRASNPEESCNISRLKFCAINTHLTIASPLTNKAIALLWTKSSSATWTKILTTEKLCMAGSRQSFTMSK